MDIRKILLPLDFFDPTPPMTIVRQAAGLAHHFGAELIVLHVVKPLTYIARSKTAAERGRAPTQFCEPTAAAEQYTYFRR